MTSQERLDLILTKVNRAEEHLRNLSAEIDRFLNPGVGEPSFYEIATKRNPDALIYYVASVRDVPARFSLIAGDVLNNCRSSLDHLANHLFAVGSPGTNPTKNTGFPISENAKNYKSDRVGKTSGMRQDAVDRIDAIKPYKEGNDAFWRLHRLNNVDKHRLLLAVASGYQGRSITRSDWVWMQSMYAVAHPGELPDFENIRFLAAPSDRWNKPLHVGYEFFQTSPESEPDPNVNLLVEITIAESEFPEPAPLLQFLDRTLTLVRGTILEFRPCLI